jgi:hypothetical protein
MKVRGLAKVTLPFRRFFSHKVAFISPVSFYLTSRSFFETFGARFIRFHFWHIRSFYVFRGTRSTILKFRECYFSVFYSVSSTEARVLPLKPALRLSGAIQLRLLPLIRLLLYLLDRVRVPYGLFRALEIR